jgi:hypothetical protein
VPHTLKRTLKRTLNRTLNRHTYSVTLNRSLLTRFLFAVNDVLALKHVKVCVPSTISTSRTSNPFRTGSSLTRMRLAGRRLMFDVRCWKFEFAALLFYSHLLVGISNQSTGTPCTSIILPVTLSQRRLRLSRRCFP